MFNSFTHLDRRLKAHAVKREYLNEVKDYYSPDHDMNAIMVDEILNDL